MSTLETIEVDITVELGAAVMPVHHLLRLGRGAVIELDATEHDPLKIYANSTPVAEGAIRLEDGRIAVEVTRKLPRPG